MSSHITHKDPSKKPCGCDKPITPSKKPCGCNNRSIRPSKLDLLITQYEELIRETTVLKNELLAKLLSLNDVATETKATSNKESLEQYIEAFVAKEQTVKKATEDILAAISNIDTNVRISNEEILALFQEEA